MGGHSSTFYTRHSEGHHVKGRPGAAGPRRQIWGWCSLRPCHPLHPVNRLNAPRVEEVAVAWAAALDSCLKVTWNRASHDPRSSPWEADHSWEDVLAGPCRQ